MEPTASSLASKELNTLRIQVFQSLDHPKELEMLYRKNKSNFRQAFNSIYPDIAQQPIAQCWNERLNYQQESDHWISRPEFIFILIASLFMGILAKIPHFTSVTDEFFYPRNLGLLALSSLVLYFNWKQQNALKIQLVTIGGLLLAALLINLYPNSRTSDTLLLSFIHLPIFIWTILSLSYTGSNWKTSPRKIEFLKFNGDFIVMCALIGLSGGLFTGITVGLFELLGLKIANFYVENIAVFGLPGVPLLATVLVQNNPQLVNRISPLIARIFTPIVFITLLVFSIAALINGKNIYQDRNFLMMFNILLIAVMAIILFSVTEASKNTMGNFSLYTVFGLSVLTILLNGVALSAIIMRISEFGFTPNRIAVIGGNILIFSCLLMVSRALYQSIKGINDISGVGKTIASFIPVFAVWAAIIAFVLPVVFGFK